MNLSKIRINPRYFYWPLGMTNSRRVLLDFKGITLILNPGFIGIDEIIELFSHTDEVFIFLIVFGLNLEFIQRSYFIRHNKFRKIAVLGFLLEVIYKIDGKGILDIDPCLWQGGVFQRKTTCKLDGGSGKCR